MATQRGCRMARNDTPKCSCPKHRARARQSTRERKHAQESERESESERARERQHQNVLDQDIPDNFEADFSNNEPDDDPLKPSCMPYFQLPMYVCVM